MAESVSIPVEDDDFDSKGQPSFQDFGVSHGAAFDVSGNIGGDAPGDSDGDEYAYGTEKSSFLKGAQGDREGEQREEERSAAGGGFFSCLSVEYYQGFFDVSTKEVLKRILWGTIPRKKPFSEVTKKRPDLYGPFWVCMTLVFSLSVCHHLGMSLESASWELEFHTVVVVFCVVYVYACVMATLVWGFFWWRAGTSTFSLLHTLCMYGYSLSGYNLFLLLVIVPMGWLIWLLVGIIASVTGLVLIYPFWVLLKEREDKKMAFILAALFLCHAGLGVALKFLTLQHSLSLPSFWGATAVGPTNSTTAGTEGLNQTSTS